MTNFLNLLLLELYYLYLDSSVNTFVYSQVEFRHPITNCVTVLRFKTNCGTKVKQAITLYVMIHTII
jgi:hypothetical protein